MNSDEAREAAEAFCNAWAESNRWRAAAGRDDEIPFRIAGSEVKLTEPLLRAILVRSAEMEAENARMREELEALREAQPSLQGSAFRIGWQTCRDKVNRATELLRGELEALDYAEEVRKLNAEPSPRPELFADECDCECQPGQPCLCPERDCYCGPCRVCGETPQQAAPDTDPDEHRLFTMDDHRDQLGGIRRQPRIGEEQR